MNARWAEAAFKFNGRNVTALLSDYIESITYTDVASGSSDTLDITLQNINEEWMRKWYPKKGDKVVGSIIFHNWKSDGKDIVLPLGSFTLDELKLSGGPLRANFGCVAVPAGDSFRTRERTKTWSSVTVKEIGKEIAERYELDYSYSGEKIQIESLEQSDETDCSFLYSLCEKYGLSMKVYAGAITIYDQTEIEQAKARVIFPRAAWENDSWAFTDTLAGIYTGARISYKSGKNDDEISIYVGFQAEDDPDSRVLKITQTAGSIGEAYRMAASEVNKSNQDATTLTGDIFPDTLVCSGVTVKVTGLGEADGKYYVDKSTITISGSGTKQSVEMHKCQPRLLPAPKKSESAGDPGVSSKDYKVGDIVNFHGGTHYVSSYAGAKGSNAKPGPAKITIINGKGGAHPWHLVHTDKTSNVYGWVDDGTFD